eukprot:gene26890-33059_t
MFSGVYWHIYIKEGGKSNKNSAENLRLGSPLTIGSEEFEDLDHILAAFVEPMAGYLQSVVKHRKFKQGTRQEVDAILVKERKANPKQFPYSLSVCYEPIGFFQLTYICSSKPSHELISFDHKGFTYRMQTFPTIDRLLDDFKKRAMRNERPPPTQPPAQRAARTPGTAPRNPMGRSPGGVERSVVTAVNQVGIDINQAFVHQWKLATLPFVSGLGPRKARALVFKLQSRGEGGCESRELLAEDLPPNVYANCVAMLKTPYGTTPGPHLRTPGHIATPGHQWRDGPQQGIATPGNYAGVATPGGAVLVLEAVVVAAAGAVKGDGARQEKVAAAVAADRGVGAM